MKNRGRIQAQGENLEASESWAQNEPPTEKEGLEMLDKLKKKIPKHEALKRKEAFEKASKYIKQTAINGGLEATTSATFNVLGKRKERVDVEIRKGIAFVPNN